MTFVLKRTYGMYSTKEILSMSDKDILYLADKDVTKRFGNFIREFNKREWEVRIDRKYATFDDYARLGYEHQDEFGFGFKIEDKPVPYFHPNRSFHDEIIWLNDHLYYRDDVSFEDKLVNSAVVKFYGPSRTLDIITGNARLPYLTKTGSKYINFDRLENDEDYEYACMSNIEKAFASGEKIWGTTELRTSLQTASRNWCRENPSSIDTKGVKGFVNPANDPARKMRPSDMIHWIKKLSATWVPFYKTKPSMEESFLFLTQERGIGNYYGYHFSSNLARMPGVGDNKLIDAEYSNKFKALQKKDKKLTHGNLDENADYVVPGPGATETLKILFPNQPINQQTMLKFIIAIRNNQSDFFGITGKTIPERHLKEASELGTFTTFGIEISCCQFNVFNRNRSNPSTARARAMAPISQITRADEDAEFCSLENFFA